MCTYVYIYIYMHIRLYLCIFAYVFLYVAWTIRPERDTYQLLGSCTCTPAINRLTALKELLSGLCGQLLSRLEGPGAFNYTRKPVQVLLKVIPTAFDAQK